MAQALSLVETYFSEKGREEAQSAIMTTIDGRPSFSFQALQVVDKLEEKKLRRYFFTVQDRAPRPT